MDIKADIIQAGKAFQKDFLETEMKKIYMEIYYEAKDTIPEQLAPKITTCESDKVNSFIFQADQKMSQFVTEQLKKAGVADTSIPFVWPALRRKIHLPKIKLCNQNPASSESIPEADIPVRKAAPQAADPSMKNGKWVLLAGAVVEVIAWVFVPALSVWQPICKGLGLITMGLGGAMIYKEHAAKSRITLTPEAVAAQKKASEQHIFNLCMEQCNLNTRLLTDWADQICEALAEEAEKLLAGK